MLSSVNFRHRHFGLSCTFGCPHKSCNFTSKCTKSFIEHVNKHLVIIPADTNESVDEFDDIYSPSKINPMKYLVDDEIGSGYGRAPREAQIKRYPDVLSLTKNKTTSKQISTKSSQFFMALKMIDKFSFFQQSYQKARQMISDNIQRE